MSIIIIYSIIFINFVVICFSQPNEINGINKNHSNIKSSIDILEQSIINIKSDKRYLNVDNTEVKEIQIAEISLVNITLTECIKNIKQDEELKKLNCCGSSTQYQLSKDKLIVDNYADFNKQMN